MTRSLILLGAAIAAIAWQISQPAFAHDTPHKQAGAQLQAGTRARAGAGRW